MSSCITVSLERQPVNGKLPVQLFCGSVLDVQLQHRKLLIADIDEPQGSILMTFESDAAADVFATEVQTGDVLAPGMERDFDTEQVSCRTLLQLQKPSLTPQVDHATQTGPVLTKEG